MSGRLLALLTALSKPAVAIGGSLAVAAVLAGGAWYLSRGAPAGSYVAAAEAPITESVSAAGAVESAQTTDLSFDISGRVSAIRVKVGDHVALGETLIALDAGSQSAALAGAKANLESAQAAFAALTAGTRPEQLAIDQNAVSADTAALTDALRSAYVAADTAVHAEADTLFTNPRTASPQFTLIVPDSALVNRIQSERAALEPMFADWNAALGEDPLALAPSASADLERVSAFLDDIAAALAKTPTSASLSASALASYQASIAAARASVSGAASAVTGASAALTAAQGALDLAQAPPTTEALQEAQAQVDAAQAALQAAQVASGKTALLAPISGTVTAQNANPGETVSPGVPLVSLESDASWQVKALVSQVDVAKVKVGDPVAISFDAYPGATFPAAITAVDPAATIANGVASYQVTATFSQNDPRIAAGLSAHLSITTGQVAEALTIPASAVITDASGQEFVYVKQAQGADVKTAVETGIESAAGMVEVRSGLAAGQEVLAFGSAH
jgi:multidrug efflux pump subunit AcrA (membrane-fusion protein)